MTTVSDRFEQLRGAAPTVLPSMLLCDFGNLEREIRQLEDAGVAGLHLDVMDGVFVPNFTYGLTIVAAVRQLTQLPLDVHLMMVEPGKYVDRFCDAGADLITFHAEATDQPAEVLRQLRRRDVAGGIAVNPETPIDSIVEAIPLADVVLLMSVHAGFGGQSFIESTLEKLAAVRNSPGGQDVTLEIDGGINSQTIVRATQSGAQLLVAGSAIFKQPSYSTAWENLMSQIAN